MIHSFKKLEPDKLFDQKHFQNDNDIPSGLVLSFDQFLEHSKGFDHLEKSFELDLQQPVFCARKSFDSFVFKENSFSLSSYGHELFTGILLASTYALDDFMDFEEEQFNYPQQGPLLDTRRPMDDDLGPIFDEENKVGPILEEEAPSITSINMENHLCFDPGTTHAPLSPNPQEPCKEFGFICFVPDLFVKFSSSDIKRFGLEKHFQNDNDIPSGLVLSFDQFLEHSKGFDHLEKSFELDLQQPVFCG
ncbi:hypothetical protein F2Q70_00027222 [Brassica cretica]|uniref:Uncharacterized protein n=1 Tax=Brassica cretica TaxID=69181 RepID=A0A8S9L6S5_BRACR|nr:hypothetical protein F2Q70_00027222 [Brassica cretica]